MTGNFTRAILQSGHRLLLFFVLAFCVNIAQSTPVVRLFVFTSPDCSHCAPAKEENLKATAAKVGCQLEYRFFDIQDMANYEKLVELEERFGDTDNEMPVVFLGRDVLGGADEVEKRLPELLAKYTAAGGTQWPDEEEVKPALATSETPHSSDHRPSHQSQSVTPKTDTQSNTKPDKSTSPLPPIAMQRSQATKGITPAKTPSTTQVADNTTPIGIASLAPVHDQQAIADHAKTSDIRSQSPAAHPIYLAFFYQYGCKECQRVTYLMAYIRHRYPNVILREFNLAEQGNKVLNEAIAIRYGVPQRRRLLPATVYIGQECVQGRAITLRNLERIIARNASAGTMCPWTVSPQELANARAAMVTRFRAVAPLTIAGAGLLDGINPCAFTTLVFFISYLFYLGKRGKDILIVGSAFAVAVFITYYVIGCGAMSLLRYITGYRLLSQGLNLVIAVGAVILGFITLIDYLKARNGLVQDIQLQLPAFLKRRIHGTVRTQMRTSQHAIAAFATGMIISILELACTGQVYLPTIMFVTSLPGLRYTGMAYLALYNLAFIIPLLIVFIFAYRGMKSEVIGQWAKRNLAAVKFATAMLFFGLGIFLIVHTL